MPLEFLELRNLKYFDYINNPIENIPSNIERWLNTFNNCISNINKPKSLLIQ